MAALDLFGRRWSLRLLWELRDGPVGARALVERCGGVSTSVLYERLRELADASLVTQDEASAYALTEIGGELGAALAPLGAWAERWAHVTSADA
jgi:DNA-binding HxlR family transcriptional regulator